MLHLNNSIYIIQEGFHGICIDADEEQKGNAGPPKISLVIKHIHTKNRSKKLVVTGSHTRCMNSFLENSKLTVESVSAVVTPMIIIVSVFVRE